MLAAIKMELTAKIPYTFTPNGSYTVPLNMIYSLNYHTENAVFARHRQFRKRESNVQCGVCPSSFAPFYCFWSLCERCQLTSPIATDMTAFLVLDKANAIVKDLDISPMLTNIIGFVCWPFSVFNRATRISHRRREKTVTSLKCQLHANSPHCYFIRRRMRSAHKTDMDTRFSNVQKKKQTDAHPHCTLPFDSVDTEAVAINFDKNISQTATFHVSYLFGPVQMCAVHSWTSFALSLFCFTISRFGRCVGCAQIKWAMDFYWRKWNNQFIRIKSKRWVRRFGGVVKSSSNHFLCMTLDLFACTFDESSAMKSKHQANQPEWDAHRHRRHRWQIQSRQIVSQMNDFCLTCRKSEIKTKRNSLQTEDFAPLSIVTIDTQSTVFDDIWAMQSNDGLTSIWRVLYFQIFTIIRAKAAQEASHTFRLDSFGSRRVGRLVRSFFMLLFITNGRKWQTTTRSIVAAQPRSKQ